MQFEFDFVRSKPQLNFFDTMLQQAAAGAFTRATGAAPFRGTAAAGPASSSFCLASRRIDGKRNRIAFRSDSDAAATAKGCGSLFLRRNGVIRAEAAAVQRIESRSYRIVTLPGDGIGPEIMSVAVDVMRSVGDRQGN